MKHQHSHHEESTKLFTLTPAAGKRLIALAVAELPAVEEALEKCTIVIIAGTTNGYIAEEILKKTGQEKDFSKERFFRGITLPPKEAVKESGRLVDENRFPGDVVIEKGEWKKGKTVFDVVNDLKEGDVILKGANAFNPETGEAGILIGHPKAGTIGAALQAVNGRRVRLLIPVGLEKRVYEKIGELALEINTPGTKGPRLFPVTGEIMTELEAVNILSGATAWLAAAGGVAGAEGAVWLAVTGTEEELAAAEDIIRKVEKEPGFAL